MIEGGTRASSWFSPSRKENARCEPAVAHPSEIGLFVSARTSSPPVEYLSTPSLSEISKHLQSELSDEEVCFDALTV